MIFEEAKQLRYREVIHCRWFNEDKCERWYINGKIKLWKRDPLRISIPLKHGLYHYSRLHNGNLHLFHLEKVCKMKGGEPV